MFAWLPRSDPCLGLGSLLSGLNFALGAVPTLPWWAHFSMPVPLETYIAIQERTSMLNLPA